MSHLRCNGEENDRERSERREMGCEMVEGMDLFVHTHPQTPPSHSLPARFLASLPLSLVWSLLPVVTIQFTSRQEGRKDKERRDASSLLYPFGLFYLLGWVLL